jgi:hypothetical protein
MYCIWKFHSNELPLMLFWFPKPQLPFTLLHALPEPNRARKDAFEKSIARSLTGLILFKTHEVHCQSSHS